MAGVYYPNNQGDPHANEQLRGRLPIQSRPTVSATSNDPPITFPEPSIPNAFAQGTRPRARSSHGPRSYHNPSPVPPIPMPPYQPINHQPQLPQMQQMRYNPPPLNGRPSVYQSHAFTAMGPPGPPPPEHPAFHRSKSVPAPPVPPKHFEPPPSAPPLPPKIPLYPDFMPPPSIPSSTKPSPIKQMYQPQQNAPSSSSHSRETPPEYVVQSSIQSQESSSFTSPEMSEQDELALALELSAKESKVHSTKLAEQEENDFARAMQESMRLENRLLPEGQLHLADQEAPHSSSDSPKFAAGLTSSPASALFDGPVLNAIDTSWNMPSPEVGMSRTPQMHSQMADDEALARRLAKEEEVDVHTTDLETPVNQITSSPPLYQEIVAPNTGINLGAASLSAIDMTALTSGTYIKRGSSASAVPSASGSEIQQSSFLRTNESLTRRRASFVESAVSVTSTSSAPELPTPSQFVDKSLLEGISFGFNAPRLSTMAPMNTVTIPNVISLPDGKRPPFHIQAPSWRQMLKLMARLSSTRIEASLEAVAASKTEYKLRTIVQFVRMNPTSPDWKMILYLTMDQVPPQNTVGLTRFTNGDVNVLPWSYTQIPPHPMLSKGADTPSSKYYTIPPTAATPYPSLPINFPNMAMYLTSAMEDSRRSMHDGSSGMRRLAKMVDAFYPAEQAPGLEGAEPEKVGVGKKFRNMFRSGKQNSRRNEETWDLVTPFVADEY